MRAPFDLLLSSGFLCFSSHAGFLQALEAHKLKPEAFVGTSSGSLAAAFAAAGMGADDIKAELCAQRPLALVRPSVKPWQGPLSTRALVKRLRGVLPETFEELDHPLAVGVYASDKGSERRTPMLVTSGPLPEAVAASCAVPGMFRPLRLGQGSATAATAVDGGGTVYDLSAASSVARRFADGGAVDRLGYASWRQWRPAKRALVHLVSDLPDGEYGPRDGLAAGDDDGGPATAGLLPPCVDGVVRTPRAKASFVSLGDYEAEVDAAAAAAYAQIDRVLELRGGGYAAAAATVRTVGRRHGARPLPRAAALAAVRMTGDDEASGDGGANDGGGDDDAEAAGADGAGPSMGSAASADGKSGDACLMEAMEALKGSDAAAARTLLSQAWRAYEAEGGPSTEQAQLLEMVGARVDAAVMPGFGKTTAPRPPPPSEDELRKRAEAKAAGEKKLMETVSVFGDKTDEGRFAKAFKLLEEAREAYRAAGSDVEREREPVLGNLYAVVRAEEERTQRVAKLVRMKRLLELTKQKKKAEALGIDPDLLERGEEEEEEDGEGEGEGGPAAAAAAAASEGGDGDLTASILEAWREEGVDAAGREIDELERQVRDLEDGLGGDVGL